MLTQTSQKAELFARALKMVILGVFVVCMGVTLISVVSPHEAVAAASNTINFQARLETSGGAIAPDGNYNVSFHLFNAAAAAGGTSTDIACGTDTTCEWSELYTYNSGSGGTDARVRVVNGYLTVNLGSITAFSSINWNQQQWLTMDIGGIVGSGTITWDGQMNPRLQLTAVPYAFQAGKLSTIDGSGHVGTLSFPTSLTNATDAITLPDASGTVCLQSSGACGFVLGSGTAFLQGGNSLGAQAELGTNDSFDLALRTNNADRLIIDTIGNVELQQASTINIVSTASGAQLTIKGGSATSGTNNGGNLLLEGGAGASTGNPGSVIVQANTNDSTTAFQVQNASGGALLTADTKNMKVNVGGNLTVYYTPSCNYSGFTSAMSGLAPTAWWKLEDTGSTAADSSGNSDTGTISGTGVAVNQTPGAFACATSHPAMAFTGSSSGNITTAGSITNPSTYTLNAIFKTSGSGPLVTFPGNVNGTSAKLYVGSDGYLHGGFYYYRGCCGGQFSIISSSPTTVNNGSWHMASLVVNTSGEWLYLDGTQVASNTTSLYQGWNQANGTGNWEIGGESNVWNSGTGDTVQYFTGSISEAAVLGSLSGANISTLAGDLGVYVSPNSYLGVNTASPAYPIDVVGDINTSTEYDIGGTAVCTSSGCTPIANSNSYVQLQSSTPGTAQTGHFNITGTGIAGTLQAGTVQATTTVKTPVLDTASAGTLTIGNANATAIAIGKTSSNIATTIVGTTIIKPATGNDSTTVFQVQNAAGYSLLTTDSTNSRVNLNAGIQINTSVPNASCSYTNFTSAALAMSPSAYWKLEDTGTTAADSSGNADTGTLSAGGVTVNQTPGPFACATTHPYMVFSSASSGTITTASTYSSPSSFSLIALFKTTSGGPLISSTGDRGLYVGSDGKLYAGVWNGGNAYAVSPGTVNDGNWHEAVMTFASSTGRLELYLDGKFVASTTGGAASGTVRWQLGYFSGSWSNLGSAYYTGSLAQVSVIPSVISAAAATDLAEYAGVNTSTSASGVGIGLLGVAPAYLLDVGGDINTSTQYRIGGTVVCTSSGCTPAAGSNNYVQLQGSSPSAQTGYFNITGTGIANILQAGTFDTAAAGALTVGTTHATSIAVGNTTSNIATTINGTTVIKPTSGHDSTTAFQVQNAGGAAVLNTDTVNNTVTVRSGNDIRTIGPNLYSGNFSSGWTTTGWDVSGVTTAVHNTGNTNSLINTSVPITAGTTYEVDVEVFACSATVSDSLAVYIGGTWIGEVDGENCDGFTSSFVGTAAATTSLTFTPTSTWPGRISNISVYALSGVINPTLVIKNASGAANIEVRANADASSTYIGLASGSNDAGGSNNAALGTYALQSNVDGTDNTAIGANALQLNSFGYSNTAVGSQALTLNTNGEQNTAIGYSSLNRNTTGSYNAAVGEYTLSENTTGTDNAVLGTNALSTNTQGSYNTAVGDQALLNNTDGYGNVAIGGNALQNNTTGDQNIAIGYNAGTLDSGNTFSTLATLQNATAIGAYAQVQANNSIVLGSVDNPTLVGIGITVPSNTFSVSPLDYQTGTATRTNSSATLVGTGTTWASTMVGDIIVFADGTTDTVSTYTDPTHITMGTTYTGVTDASPVAYRFHHVGLQVTSAGNVGIGTNSPAAILDVAGGTSGEDISFGPWINGSNYGAIYLNGLFSTLGDYNLMSANNDQSLYINRPTGGAIKFRENNGSTDQLTIAPGGNIGINTASPGSILDVAGGPIHVAGSASSSIGSGQGTYLSWNATGGTGETDFINQHGGGTGGFNWYDTGGTTFTTASPIMRLQPNGFLGIGTASPNHPLSVTENTTSTKAVSISNFTTTDSTSVGILELRGGWSTTAANSRYIQFYSSATTDTNGTGEGSVDARSGGVTYNTSTADFGEYFTLLNPMQYGDIAVSSTTNGSYGVTQSTSQNANIVGVLSNTAGFVGNAKYLPDGSYDTTNRDIVGLVGQIKTHVSDINGPIHVGDPITASDIPGYGAKAVVAGQIVGRAMESFDPTTGSAVTACPAGTTNGVNCGTIMVLVNPSWYDPGTEMAGNLQGNDFSSLNVTGDLTTYRLTVTSDATFKANIIVEGHVITAGDTPTIATLPAAGLDYFDNNNSICTVSGNDTSGTITLTAGTYQLAAGAECTLTFSKAFTAPSRPVVSAVDQNGARVAAYANATATTLTLYFGQQPLAQQTYTFNYWNAQ